MTAPRTVTRDGRWGSIRASRLGNVQNIFRSRTEGQLARSRTEPDVDQHLLPRRSDDRLAVHALQRELARTVPKDERGERLERRADTLVVVLDQQRHPAPALLDVDHRLGPGEHDVRAADASRAPLLVLALGP